MEDKDEADFLNVFKNANADIFCLGHVHKPYHRILNSTEDKSNHFCHAVDIVSRVKSKDGDIRGCYVMLTLNQYINRKVMETIQVEFFRPDYDVTH